ncbi:MAG: flagellar basal body rod protein FlgC [Armatimonadetes bacterium]|nr:flagellar basal body rod protein FlgC [Armatimonadota bacterium]
MGLLGAMRTSSTGMTAERFRMDVISQNIAGANTVQTPFKDAYRRKEVVLSSTGDGVKVDQIAMDKTPLQTVYDPSNPYADAQGNIKMSNVQPVFEMVNMLSASRAYEANIAAFNAARSMAKAALNIGNI